MPAVVAEVVDPFSGVHVSWVLWIVPVLIGGAVAWYLFAVRHRAYEPRSYMIGAGVAIVIAIASLAKLVHEADKALRSLPLGAGGFAVFVVLILLYAGSQQPRRGRW